MHRYFIFYKPYEVLSQFSKEGDKKTLADYFLSVEKNVYPVGRLDYDSEGLLLLTNDTTLTHRLLHPHHRHARTYYVQVDGNITDDALHQLEKGVTISINGKLHQTATAIAKRLVPEPSLPDRHPPIRYRKNIPTSWIALTLTEGKNRQVRRMTAAVGFPTLRLVRYSIGKINVLGMKSGEVRELSVQELQKLFR